MNNLIASFLILSAVVTNQQAIANYTTNRVNEALSPFTIEDCTSVRYFTTTTNEVSLLELKPGDKVTALIDIPLSTVEPGNTNGILMGENIVGFINITIPEVVNNPPLLEIGE